MKKTFFILLILTAFISCKKGEVFKGEFIFYDNAAVLQTDSIIYGVIINDKAKELEEKAKKFKTEPTDMVQVEIRGTLTNQKDEKILWENKIEIKEILNVFPPKNTDNVIKIGKE